MATVNHPSLTPIPTISHRKAWLSRIAGNGALPVHPASWLNRIAGNGALPVHPAPRLSLLSLLLLLLLVFSPTASAAADARSLIFEHQELVPRQTAASTADSPLPFDSSIGNNFTQPGCKAWIGNFIQSVAPCHPVSLLLQTSNGFFDATKSLVTISSVLSTSCAVDFESCSALMAAYSGEILSSEGCLEDYENANPIVTQAYAGLLAYQPLFQATCLTQTSSTSPPSDSSDTSPPDTSNTSPSDTSNTSPSDSSDTSPPSDTSKTSNTSPSDASNTSPQDTSNTPPPSHTTPPKRSPPAAKEVTASGYCYAAAVTNTSAPSGSYIYYLPLGFPLPGGSTPTCNSCLQRTMQGFAAYATNASQPLSRTYAQAASSVNLFCGPGFVDDTVAVGGAVGAHARRGWVGVVTAAAVAVWILL